MVRLDLPVEEPVLLDPGVAVDGPQKAKIVLAALNEKMPFKLENSKALYSMEYLVGLVPEHGRCGSPVDLDVAPG